MVFGKAVPKGSPVIGRHTATATSGAHLPSLVKRRGVGVPYTGVFKVKWSELNYYKHVKEPVCLRSHETLYTSFRAEERRSTLSPPPVIG
jgi:hypothetical protein